MFTWIMRPLTFTSLLIQLSFPIVSASASTTCPLGGDLAGHLGLLKTQVLEKFKIVVIETEPTISVSLEILQGIEMEVQGQVHAMSNEELKQAIQQRIDFYNSKPGGYVRGLDAKRNVRLIDEMIDEYRADVLDPSRKSNNAFVNYRNNVKAVVQTSIYPIRKTGPVKSEHFNRWINNLIESQFLKELESRITLGSWS